MTLSLFLYRLLMALALPVALVAVLVGVLRGRLPRGALRDRLGLSAGRAEVWVHGASVGELASVRGLVGRMVAARPGLRVLVTSNTATAQGLVAGWGMAGMEARLAPFDAMGGSARVLRRWQPGLLVVVENELWPGRLAAARALGVPVAMVGARLSERSAARWRRLPGLARQVFGGLALVSPQDEGSRDRLLALGVAADRMGLVLNLKAGVAAVEGRAGPVPRARCLLAASTHEGEEALALEAFAARRDRFDLLILAPRHPERFDAVAREIAARGWPVRRRSAGDAVAGPVYLADSLGEMALWYSMAGVTLVGGTFAARGGHTPFEPVAAGSVVVHGPSVANHAAGFAGLDASGAALACEAEGIAGALAGLDEAAQARMAGAARAALAAPGMADALDDLAARLLRLMDQPSG